MRKVLKQIFPIHSDAFLFLFKFYDYKYWFPKYWMPTRWPLNPLVRYSDFRQNVSFIQVGSNNGVAGDPLYNYIVKKGWRGILIEPVPYLFDALMENYSPYKLQLIFENSAIASVDGDAKFYRLEKTSLPGMPVWYDQLGSFNKEVVLKHRNAIPCFDDLFIEDTVTAISFETLVKKHSIKKVNLIHLDTEGYDFEILKLIPFESLQVELIMFEHVHLTDADYKQAVVLLKSAGYKLGIIDTDTVGVHKKIWSEMNTKC